MRSLTLVLAASLAGTAVPAGAQIPLPTPPQSGDTTRADTVPVPQFRIHPPVAPFAAFGRSLLFPGWGQAVLGRRGTGAVFVFWEGLTLTMTLKASHQLRYMRRIGEADEERIAAKKQEIQDWAVLLAFNHLVSAAEAFVSAHLWDFPVELDQRMLPGERAGMGVRIELPD